MTKPIDLLLLTALAEEEQVVESVLEQHATRVKREGELAFYDYTHENKVYRVAALSACHQGAVSMGIFASSVFARLQPQFAALVGIAAAVDLEEVGLGDVPCTRSVFSYDDLKVDDGRLTIRSGGFPADLKLITAVLGIQSSPSAYKHWREECKSQIEPVVELLNLIRPKRRPNKQIQIGDAWRAPQLVEAITAGGPFLIADADFRDSLRKTRDELPREQEECKKLQIDQPLHPKLVSAEMESHGFMQAANYHRVPAIVLKGISDLGDKAKTKTEKQVGGFYRVVACANATLAALHMLRKFPPLPPPTIPERSLWRRMSEYAENVFTWGNPIVVHGDAEQYASFARSLLGKSLKYVLWTLNGSPLAISDALDSKHLTTWDRAFSEVDCRKLRLVVFRTDTELTDYKKPPTEEALQRRSAFEDACGKALRFTSLPLLRNQFRGLVVSGGLDIGFVRSDGRDLCFYSPFATRDLGEQIPSTAPIVLFSTSVKAPNAFGRDHKESGVLLERLGIFRSFVEEMGKATENHGWFFSDASAVPRIDIPTKNKRSR